MSLAHKYAEFGPIAGRDAPSSIDPEPLEELKLKAFENGYQAGWDDAVQAHENDREKMSADLAQNFQDMSFTFHEAHAKLTSAMRPLLEQMVAKLLPDVANQSLAGHVLEQLSEMVAEQATGAIEIAVSPENLAAINAVLEGQIEMPFTVTAEPALSSGQVYLRAGRVEREINLDTVLAGISQALVAFFHQAEKEESHG